MSTVNLGDQYITFDYHHPAQGKEFNTLLREAINPGVYSGGTITYAGTQATIAPFVVYIETDEVSSNKLVRVETRVAITISINESTPVIALTYTWDDVSENWLDFNQRASGSSALPYEVCLGECVFTLGVITSITYASKTWGRQTTNDVPVGITPFYVTSTTKVTNLNAEQVDGADLSTDVTFAANSDILIPSQKAVKTLTSHPITSYKTASYPITDTDGIQIIEADTVAGANTITLPLMANNRGRRIRVQFVKNDVSADVVTVVPHATDTNKLSNDGLASIILPKVGDYVEFQESVNSGCWEIVNERITSQLRLNTYAGYGSTDNKIMRFTNLETYLGNMFTHNHTSGYSGNSKGLEIIILKSGSYSFEFGHCSGGAGSTNFCFSINSVQLTTAASGITVGTRRAYAAAATSSSGMSIALSEWFPAGTVIRAHTAGDIPGVVEQNDFTIIYNR